MPYPNTLPATEAVRQYAAERAAADPRKLSKARRVVGHALVAGTITVDELLAEAERAARSAPKPDADTIAKLRALLPEPTVDGGAP